MVMLSTLHMVVFYLAVRLRCCVSVHLLSRGGVVHPVTFSALRINIFRCHMSNKHGEGIYNLAASVVAVNGFG